MKYLKIEENKGFFLRDKNDPPTWIEIDQIEKNDLLKLLNSAINEEFEFDIYEDAKIGNKAHQIIYKHLAEKLTNFLTNKDRFRDEAESIYKEAFDKYQ